MDFRKICKTLLILKLELTLGYEEHKGPQYSAFYQRNQRIKLTNQCLSFPWQVKATLGPSESLQDKDLPGTQNLPNLFPSSLILCLVSIWEKAERAST